MSKPFTRYLTPAGKGRDRWIAEGGYAVTRLRGEPRPHAYEISHASGRYRCGSLDAAIAAIEAHKAGGEWE